MKRIIKIIGLLIVSGVLTLDAGFASAKNKVVVIPLGSDEVRDPLNGKRTLLFSAGELSGNGPINSQGRSFSNTFVSTSCCAHLVLKRPADWDGTSDVTVELFTRGQSTGTEAFFVRPRDYNDGDTFLDTVGRRTDIRNFTASGQFRVFTIDLPASSLPKDWWFLVIQRDTTNGTNTGEISLLSMAVNYTARQ